MRRTVRLVLVVATLAAGLAAAQVAGPAPAGAGTGGFTDVPTSHPFYGHILWMDEEDLADGFPDGTFRPEESITRGAMAAFLYRAAGEPTFTPPGSPTFTDVPTFHPFFLEIEWMADEGITTGFPDGTFRSQQSTNRQAMAAYLYRFSESPAFTNPGSPSFPDVPTNHPFFHEIEWLVSEEVTTGFEDGTYRPTVAVNRASMSAFIFRALHLAPELDVDNTFITGMNVAWDLAFTPEGAMLYTQRPGTLRVRVDDDTDNLLLTSASGDMADLYANFETGLMGIAVDPDFGTNRTFYTCQGETGANPNAQVVEWTVNGDYTDVDRVGGADGDVIDLAPWLLQPGRHGGCRIRFGPESPNRHLWISAGDTACGTYPQNTSALAGKILRIDEDTGLGVSGNPFFGGAAADDPVYTYGHRNPQGLALRPGTNQMWSVEHGPGIDDEVNLLQAGGNYGWNPVGGGGTCQGYNENVPMTDLAEFPNAVPAAWDTDGPTIATSGGTFLEGDSWGGWNGGFIVAALAGQQARVLFFTDSGVFIEERRVEELDGAGRLRGPAMGIGGDEALYLTSDQRIFRIEATP